MSLKSDQLEILFRVYWTIAFWRKNTDVQINNGDMII